jgi:hypothetical protein
MNRSVRLLFLLAIVGLTLVLCSGGSLAQVNFTGPQPGDVYKEFTVVMNVNGTQWRVTDPNLATWYPANAALDLPNPVVHFNIGDLAGAARAEAVISVWGGHVGTKGKQIQFNGLNWIPLPEYTTQNGIPAGVAGELYLNQVMTTLPVPLNQLVQGDNYFTGTNTGQNPKYSFNWGMFAWYAVMIRVYYDPAQKPHPTGYISSPVNYGILNENPTIAASVSGNVNRVDFLGSYSGYDEDGDGNSNGYHYDYHLLTTSDVSMDIHNHVGTATTAPWQVTWNTQYVPDQAAGGVKFLARIRDNNGVWYCSPEVVNVSLYRNGTSVKLFQVTDLKERAWAKGDVGTVTNSVNVPSISGVTSAVYLIRSYNMTDVDKDPGDFDYRRFNNYTDGVYGGRYNYSLDIRTIPLDQLYQGTNTFSFYSSVTVHHGIEILWPGPALELRYTGNYSGPLPLASTPASPSSGSSDVATSPVLAWNPTPAGTSYQLQVSTDAGFGSTVFDQSGLTDTTKQVSSLSALATYYWRVRATGPAGTGDWSTPFSFTTKLGAPNHVAPGNGATNISIPATIRWQSTPGATGYTLQVSSDPTFNTALVVNDATITDTSYQASGLSFATQYYWHVKAMGITGQFSLPWSFVTIVGPSATPALSTPANGTQGLAIASIDFAWQSAQWATSYRLQIATDPAFGSGIVFDDSTIATTTKSVTGFQTDKIYYWRVRGKGAGGIGTFSSPWSFETVRTIPLAASLAYPANGATSLPVIGLTFRWHAISGVTHYGFQLATDSLFTTGFFKNDTALVDTNRLVNGLQANTRYFWRVRGRNAAGWGSYSPAWSMTTIVPIPGQVALIGPASAGVAQSDSAVFTWNMPTPPASKFTFEIALDSLFTSFRSIDTTLTDTVKVFRPLINGQWYYWRVKGGNAGGWGPFSETRTVHVVISSVSEHRSGIPETFALEQNHPNPFNPSTKIGFSLPHATQARLEVYNMLGQKVATLLDEHMEAGNFTMTFDATSMPSGMYLYRLVTSSGSLVKKMILMK